MIKINMPWLNDNIAALALQIRITYKYIFNSYGIYNGLVYEYMKEDIRYLNFFYVFSFLHMCSRDRCTQLDRLHAVPEYIHF